MQNASKLFGAKATGSFNRRFQLSLVKLTLIYVALLAIILFLSSSVLYSFFSNRLDHRFRSMKATPPEFVLSIHPPSQEEVQQDLIYSLILVNGLLLVVAGAASYLLAQITLEPLNESYQRQRQFLGDASHELRTPLSILRMDLETEARDATSLPKTKERARSNLEEVERMSHLVEDLLVLSRMDEDHTKPHTLVPIELGAFTNNILARLQPLADKQTVTLIPDPSLTEKEVQIHSHEDLLSRVLTNIIKNAIVYNVPNGTVSVALKKDAKEAAIIITDTGIGIPKEELHHIFERFYRVDKSRSRQSGGSGLGLAIVKSSVDRLGGTIDITSEPGKGTAVTLRIPLR